MIPIKCDICGYEFKTLERVEQHYHDYELCDELVRYPDPKDKNPAHLLRNYVCDRCYKDISNIIKKRLAGEGREYIKDLPSRIEKEKQKFEDKVKALEYENRVIDGLCVKLEKIEHLYELTPEEICLIKKYQYQPFHTYYLDDAITLDIERTKDERTIIKWINLFNVDVLKLPGNRQYSDMVTVKEFRFIIENSILKDFSYQDMQRLLNRIDRYIEKSKGS